MKKVKKARVHAVPISKWIWLGYPQHFCAAKDCRFHMATIVGKYVISTVGDYHPPRVVQGDEGPDRMQPTEKPETIGAGPDSFYETFVFRCDGLGQCGCCAAITSMDVLDGPRTATAVEAQKCHMEMCRKYARRG